MKNRVKYNNKIYTFKHQVLRGKGGQVECKKCGHWSEVKKFQRKHFEEEFECKQCAKETKKYQAKVDKIKVETGPQSSKLKITIPDNCPHKHLHWCKTARGCKGCYYHPVREIAMMKRDPEDEDKPDWWWFYADEEDARERLKTLDDIRLGKGLFPNGKRCNFRFAQKEKVQEDDE